MCSQFLRHKFAGFYPIVLRWCDFAEEEKLFATLDEFFFGRNREITGYVKPANNFFALNQQRRP